MDLKWPRDERKRYPKVNLNKNKQKNKCKKAKTEKIIFYACVVIFSKIIGRNGSAFTEVLSTNAITIAYKT